MRHARLGGLCLVSLPVLANPSPALGQDTHIRTEDAGIRALIADGSAQSPTFKHLIDEVNATDGIVYVLRGSCRVRVRACLLLHLTYAGSHRVLRLVIEQQKADRALLPTIAHELVHAHEVLSHQEVRSTTDMYALYARIAIDPPQSSMQRRNAAAFETQNAIDTGQRVREELAHVAR
jgi:hypothetical protein